jgi:hypothetical protein
MKNLDLINDLFFKDRPISYLKNKEGQMIDDNNRYVLGLMAGPSCELQNLLHEMSHLAEIDRKRLIKKPVTSWGLSFGKYWQIGTSWGYEPQTDQSVQREIRVWAYQHSISKALNLENGSSKELASSAHWLDAFFLYKHYTVGTVSEAVAKQNMAWQIEELSDTVYTYDRFCQEWDDRMKLIA